MTVTETRTNNWLEQLLFSTPRVIQGQEVDGLFYGNLGATGDGSGGDVILNGNVSFARKEDWIYEIQQVTPVRDAQAATQVDLAFSTGPIIPSGGAGTAFPIFRWASPMENGGSPSMGLSPRETAWHGLVVFGDKKISGDFTLVQATFGVNTNGGGYSMAIWGFLYRYATFFRGNPRSLRNTPFLGIR